MNYVDFTSKLPPVSAGYIALISGENSPLRSIVAECISGKLEDLVRRGVAESSAFKTEI